MVDATPTLWDKPGREVLGWQFIEIPSFSRRLDTYIESDEVYSRLQHAMAFDPEAGDVMPGCGGLRKLRWTDPRRGKGKRGGLRIIYLLVPEVRVIVLVDLYDKGEAEDLAPGEKREVAVLAKRTKDQLILSRPTRKETGQ